MDTQKIAAPRPSMAQTEFDAALPAGCPGRIDIACNFCQFHGVAGVFSQVVFAPSLFRGF